MENSNSYIATEKEKEGEDQTSADDILEVVDDPEGSDMLKDTDEHPSVPDTPRPGA